ncbi:hypothetical protein FACS1894219_11260 [Clostridia bacterium]|nr:hypothetical protein FACS1894219_11260 [Clostridia bacterium]
MNTSSNNVLDGKQRTLTLCAFVEDKFALSPKIRNKELDGIPLVGKFFSDLTDTQKNHILDYELSVSILRPLETDDRATVFFLRNQAVSLSKIDLSRVVMGETAMNIFANLCGHNFLTEKVKLTAPALRKHDDLTILLQYLILRTRPETGFSGKEIMSFCDDIKSDEVKLSLEDFSVLDYFDNALAEKRKYLKKAYVPVIMYVAQLAQEKGIEPADFGERLDAFFDNLDPDEEYMDACKSGSSQRAKVQVRVRVLSEAVLQSV